MIINVIDLEATCWDRRVSTPSEIIQIGVSQLDTTKRGKDKRLGAISEPFSIFVKPREVFELSDFCKTLTGISDEDVFQRGVFFPEAMEVLEDRFKLSSFPWASWGDYDRRMFSTTGEKEAYRMPLNSQHLNVKAMFHVFYNHRCGLDKAMTMLGLEMQGRHHDGGDDAYNTARLLREMLPSHTSHKRRG